MNVLLLLVDTLRSDFLGCYGNLNVKTSVLDEFAGEGVRFEQAISTATWTPPSVSALVSGIYPHRLGMFRFDKPFDEETKPCFTISWKKVMRWALLSLMKTFSFPG